tara:strand:+ start:203 stop:397 length:195 start_codon:yes stop_codon:yes gene_type:complete
MKTITFDEVQDRISDLGESIHELDGRGDSPEKRKELRKLKELRNSMPEWQLFISEMKSNNEMPY